MDTMHSHLQPIDQMEDSLDTDIQDSGNVPEQPEQKAPPAPEAESKPEPPREPQRVIDPSYTVSPDVVADTTRKMQELDAGRDRLAEQYENGEIDFKGYEAAARRLDQERINLSANLTRAQIYADMQAQNQQARWDAATKAFLSAPENAAFASSAVQSLLVQEVQQVWRDPNSQHLDYSEVLRRAKEAVQESLRSILGGKSEATPGAEKAKPALDAIQTPKTLGDIPSARGNSVGSSDFSHLDSLTGIQLEAALSRMPRDQVDRYLDA